MAYIEINKFVCKHRADNDGFTVKTCLQYIITNCCVSKTFKVFSTVWAFWSISQSFICQLKWAKRKHEHGFEHNSVGSTQVITVSICILLLFIEGVVCPKHRDYIWQLSETRSDNGGAVNRFWSYLYTLALLGNPACFPSVQCHVWSPGFSGRNWQSRPSSLHGVQPICSPGIQWNGRFLIMALNLKILNKHSCQGNGLKLLGP